MTLSVFTELSGCRICGGDRLDDVFDLGVQALASRFPRPGEAEPPAVPLVLVCCADCGLVQLKHSVRPSELYTYGYGYRSGTNATMRGHLAGLVGWIQERCVLGAGDVVVDIGCNDGTLLKAYATAGLRRVGFDAIAGKFRQDYPADITLHEGFFSPDAYRAACGADRAKAISSIAMFYDLERPGDFVSAVAGALTADGIWVLEQSYLPSMLETNAYDTICHEHLEYYGLRQIETLAERGGLRVFDAEVNACNGGSFRVAVCHRDGPYAANTAQLELLRQYENHMGLGTQRPFLAFRERVERHRAQLVGLIDRERAAGKTFYLYGASTKGNTMLQYCGIDGHRIVAAAERNPEKFGCRTPATGIPIVSEEEARARHPDYFLVLPWHFRNEIVQREAAFCRSGGKLVFPLPDLDIV